MLSSTARKQAPRLLHLEKLNMNLPLDTTADCQGPPRPTTQTSTNPFLFLIGAPRSGTTMLKRMVNSHPQIAMTRETHWIPGIFENRRAMDEAGFVTPAILDKLFEHHRFEQIKCKRRLLVKYLARNSRVHYGDLVSFLFDNFGRRKHKSLVGDKTPTYVRKIPTLHSLWPEARFVHIIRDGREVWLSMKNWRMAHKAAGQFATWKSDPLVTTALWWKAHVGMGRRDGQRLGSRSYLEVMYDSLVADPGRECRRIACFLGVEYDHAMESYFLGHTRSDEALSTNAAWLPPMPGRRNWRTQMDPADVERFEAAAGDLLAQLGFERCCERISRSVQTEVDSLKQQFANEVSGRWQLPEPW